MSSRQFWSERKNLRFTNKQLFLRYPFPYHSHAICPFSVPNLKFLEQCLIFYDAYFIIDTKLLHLSMDDKICSWSDPFCWYCILLVMFLASLQYFEVTHYAGAVYSKQYFWLVFKISQILWLHFSVNYSSLERSFIIGQNLLMCWCMKRINRQ